MKTTKEVLEMLVQELTQHLDKIESIDPMSVFYNEELGDTSFLLAGLLGLLLKKRYSEWRVRKWIDDSLITGVAIQNSKLIIEGVMIWGELDTTEQWTDPFSFEIELHKSEGSFRRFNFLFCDFDNAEITYEDFRDNHVYWTKTIRKWKYTIDSNEVLL